MAADLELQIAPLDRHGSRFAMWQRDWRAADYTRRRVLGGGHLDVDEAPDLRLLPGRWWRRRWTVKAGRAGWATVATRPRGEPRLEFRWVDGAERSGLAMLCACYAIVLDEFVSGQMPDTRGWSGDGG